VIDPFEPARAIDATMAKVENSNGLNIPDPDLLEKEELTVETSIKEDP
jgi:hypothetical protein